MSLKVKVESCKDLPNFEKIGVIDPYVVLTFRSIEKTTSVIDDTVNPVWDNEEFEWTLQSPLSTSEHLKIEVYDEQTIGKNRLVGSVEYAVSQLWGQKNKSESLKLNPSKHSSGVKNADKAIINLSMIHVSLSEQVAAQRKQAGSPENGANGGRTAGGTDNGTLDEEGDNGYGLAYGYGDGDEGGQMGGTGVTSVNGAPARKRVRHPKLPDKEMAFQVKIHVIEARKLEGNNINPLIKVSCGDESQKTSTRRGTNSPVFDETLIFNFKERPVELFEKKLEIKVMSTGKKLRDCALGFFSLEIGAIYYEPKHTFHHKWLLLTDADDPSLGAKGFLKATLSVLGPDDDPVTSNYEVSPDYVDIESNLLRPSGVRLQEATLSVKLYSAEDLPQMDPEYFEKFKSFFHLGTGKKELVDPFATLSYAGHKVDSEVKWNTQNPEWNEQLNIGYRFPSICERVRIELKDKDKLNADDFIGTCIINIPEISAPGDNGFLPTLGPCFINVYGSPREYTDLPDKYDHLNKGLCEGVAYRGRVLIEISTSLDGMPKEKKEMMSLSEIRKLQPFQRRQRYVLFAVFMSASMLYADRSDQISFEISIGNYGYSGDKTVVAQSSTTQSACPKYDGRNYSYMPWGHRKPLVLLESFWENCQYRIESMNLFINITDRLEDGLNSIKRLLNLPKKYSELAEDRLYDLSYEIMEKLLSCKLNMLKLPEVYNKLDKLMKKYREQEIDALCSILDGIAANLNMPLDKKMERLTGVLERLKSICVEAQNSIPDVIIWMMVNGKRVASTRIPSHKLMYSDESSTRGSMCGKVQSIQLNPPAIDKEKELDGNKNSCLLQAMLWLGLEKDKKMWANDPDGPGGEFTTYAETYENEAYYGVWGSGKKLAFPHFSNATGKVKLNKEYFEPPPPGWQWGTPWEIDSEDSDDTKVDTIVTVDIYEVQTRDKFTPWPLDHDSVWADTSGLALVNFNQDGTERQMTRDDIEKEITKGWTWITQWKIDDSGAVSSDGWEYSTTRYDPDEGMTTDMEFVPMERNDHITRRRKWMRTRELSSATHIQRDRAASGEGWSYARNPRSSYHKEKHKLDFFRRRKWIRLLTCEEIGRPAVFYIVRKRDKKKRAAKMRALTDSESEDIAVDVSGLGYQITPHMYLTFNSDEYTTYQLRAYIYQARDLYAADNTGLSDPYVVITCGNASSRSKTILATLSPKWNETLVLNRIKIYGSPRAVVNSPPLVALEMFDKDIIGQNEFLGIVKVSPLVRMSPDIESPVLEWFQITRYGKPAGEILAAFELIRIGDHGWVPPELKTGPDNCFAIPPEIQPEVKKMRVEVLCWGVRDMQRYHLLPVDHPFVEVECGGEVKATQPIKKMSKNPLFPNPILIMDTELPVEEVYSPPFNLKVYDQRKFGYSPLVGCCTITSLKEYEEAAPEGTTAMQASIKRQNTLFTKKKEDFDIDLEMDNVTFTEEDDYRFDWWSKYYASVNEHSRVQEGYLDENHDTLKAYDKELETFFDNFTDIAHTYPLYRGKGQQNTQEEDSNVVGYFKGSIKVYPINDQRPPEAPKFLTELPIQWPIDVVVRVYIVRGFDLQPKDLNGSSDPYIKISVGKKEITDKDNYIPSQLNPLFGKVFEVDASLPFDRNLTVTVMDHDLLSADDVIGSTTIDLENRSLSHYRPTCALPVTYSKIGCNRWRDFMLPVDILNLYCKWKGCKEPMWEGNTSVTVDGKPYHLEEFERDMLLHPNVGDQRNRLALHVLRSRNFVFEHVEKRTLYNQVQPGEPQGYLHMWVDVFPKLPGVIIPPKVDITPRQPEKLILRVIVWNTSDVILVDRSGVTGEEMSDIYVKGWMNGSDDIQSTDIHYRSLDGDGMFNWRMVFPVDYIRPEKKMIIKVKEHFFSLDKTERRLSTCFNLQVLDNDLLNSDDFLGKIEFDLHSMPALAKTESKCSLNLLNPDHKKYKTVNLFEQKHVKGWLPVFQEDYQPVQGERREQLGNRTITGKVEIEMEMLTAEEHEARPAAKGRDEPNQHPVLPAPNRPALSFAWYTSPLKTFKHIVWRQYRKRIILGIILFIFFFSFLMLL